VELALALVPATTAEPTCRMSSGDLAPPSAATGVSAASIDPAGLLSRPNS
jgi:hypothetical protein